MSCCDKKSALTRLRRAAGHLAKVIKMVEDDAYCVDTIQQNLAVVGHLRSANHAIFDHHLHTCLVEGIRSGDAKKEAKLLREIAHVLDVTAR